MYKAIIVDDEYYIREGLMKIIDWESMGVEVVATAETGVEGLELYKKLRPEIVLADVSMKLMTGLEMIKKIKEIAPSVQFIIISGYKKFEYAKSAMENGVYFYLLKPVKTGLLMDAVEKTTKNLDEIKRKELTVIFDADDELIHLLLARKTAFYPQGSWRVCVLWFDRETPGRRERLEFYERMNEVFPEVKMGFVSGQTLALMIPDEAAIRETLKKIVRCVREFLEADTRIGCGGRVWCGDSPECFITEYQRAEVALSYHFYLTDNRVILYDDIERNVVNIDYKLITLSGSILTAAESEDAEALDACIQRLNTLLSSSQYLPDDLQYWFRNLFSGFMILMNKLDVGQDMNEQKEYNEILRMVVSYGNNLDHFVKLTTRFCHSCVKRISDDRQKSNVAKTICDITDYLDAHYNEDISLEHLSRMFYVEEGYLSKLFKRETGVNYLQYLTARRIEKSKEYLRNASLSVAEISGMVSYSNSKYFSQLFKKIVGVTPSRYREQMTRGF